LTRFLSRIDFEPCVYFHDEVIHHLAPVWGQLERHSFVRELPATGCAPCPECGQHVRHVRAVVPAAGSKTRLMIACPDCGPAVLPPDALRRWSADLDRLLVDLGRATGTAGTPAQLLPGLLWSLGVIPTVGTRSRSAYFARVRGEADAARVAEIMDHSPASVLFFASPHGIGSWRRASPRIRLALSELLTLGEFGLEFNVPFYAACLRAQEDDQSKAYRARRSPRRGPRADTIFRLEEEICEFLRRAQDHAFHTEKATGTAALLPRPSQEYFANALGVSPSTVSRIIAKDERAKMVRLLWGMTENLDEIRKWDRRVRH
jgi:hypothetical protein